MKQTLTLNDLTRLLAERCGNAMDSAQAENFIRQFFSNIATALQTEERVELNGLGTFARDSATNKVTFIPSQELADKINEPFSFFEAVELDDKYVDEEPQKEPEETAAPEAPVQPEAPEPVPAVTEAPAPKPVVDHSPIEVSYDAVEHSSGDETEASDSAEKGAENTYNQTVTQDHTSADSEQEGWHMPWWIPGLIGLFIGFAIGYGINLVTLPDSEDYDDGDTEEVEQLVADIQAEMTQSAPAADSIVPEPVAPAPEVKDKPTAAPVSEPTKDTVRSGYYLTSMARKYFGDTNFWCYIYEENKQKLGDPNKIPAGTEVVIPSAEKYGIDKNNPESIKKAKAKVAEINARYK